MFKTNHSTPVNFNEVLHSLDLKVTADMNFMLTTQCTKEEVWDAFNQMHPCKAPGPDEMQVIFYQKFWHTVGDDEVAALLLVLCMEFAPMIQ